MTRLGRIYLSSYRGLIRVRSKCFSLLIAGAFAGFGKKSVLIPPVRLSGEHRIFIGDNVFIGSGSWLQTLANEDDRSIAISIGSGTSIAGGCVISAVSRVTIEEYVLLARNVYISDHMHRHTSTTVPILSQGLDRIKTVRIKSGAWLGQNVVVCPGVTVGRNAVVGANSVVTRDVPDFAVAVGSPARVVKVYSSAQDA
jgi:acetyltransferase-like isoleucine patch superfamily enzyme